MPRFCARALLVSRRGPRQRRESERSAPRHQLLPGRPRCVVGHAPRRRRRTRLPSHWYQPARVDTDRGTAREADDRRPARSSARARHRSATHRSSETRASRKVRNFERHYLRCTRYGWAVDNGRSGVCLVARRTSLLVEESKPREHRHSLALMIRPDTRKAVAR
jgi:hypothetical protein